MKKEAAVKISDLVNCPVTATMGVIGGKWKILILYLIGNDVNRFGKLSMLLKRHQQANAYHAVARAGAGWNSAEGDLPGDPAARGIFSYREGRGIEACVHGAKRMGK